MARLPILLSLCMAGWLTAVITAQTPPAPPVTERGVVFAVDGSAHLRGIADDLRQAVAEADLHLRVESFAWSHGAGRVFADLHGHDHQKAKGSELAGLIRARRKTDPSGAIYIVCHSSGAAVVLAAAEELPAGAVERIILLAPALGPNCDLRPALRCARGGVDSFHSQNDVVGRFLAVVGNADGQFLVSAGSTGFTPPERSADASPYANLRQHAWDWEMSKTGHLGGHFGCTRSGFLRAYVTPLLGEKN